MWIFWIWIFPTSISCEMQIYDLHSQCCLMRVPQSRKVYCHQEDIQSHDPWWFNICAKRGGRVVWIGLWRSAPTHSSHSIASRERFQVIREMHPPANRLLLLHLLSLTHAFCSLAHPDSGDALQGQRLALLSDLPQGDWWSDKHSARDLFNELPPTD